MNIDENKQVSEETSVENESEKEVQMYSEEEYNKAIQSASSKAKNELLKELGITSVKEFKEEYKTKIDEYDSIKAENQKLQEQFEKEQEKRLLSEVDDEFKDEALILAKAKVQNGDLETAIQNVLNKNPNWRVGNKDIKIGTDKSDHVENNVSNLSKKYPWIK